MPSGACPTDLPGTGTLLGPCSPQTTESTPLGPPHPAETSGTRGEDHSSRLHRGADAAHGWHPHVCRTPAAAWMSTAGRGTRPRCLVPPTDPVQLYHVPTDLGLGHCVLLRILLRKRGQLRLPSPAPTLCITSCRPHPHQDRPRCHRLSAGTHSVPAGPLARPSLSTRIRKQAGVVYTCTPRVPRQLAPPDAETTQAAWLRSAHALTGFPRGPTEPATVPATTNSTLRTSKWSSYLVDLWQPLTGHPCSVTRPRPRFPESPTVQPLSRVCPPPGLFLLCLCSSEGNGWTEKLSNSQSSPIRVQPTCIDDDNSPAGNNDQVNRLPAWKPGHKPQGDSRPKCERQYYTAVSNTHRTFF